MCARIVDKTEKKNQIISAAVRVFARKGFSESTISEIAAAAGIGKGTVYEYFENKDEIIHDAFRFFLSSQEFDLEEILLSKVLAKEKLLRVLDLFLELAGVESRELIELMFIFWSEGIKSKDGKGMLTDEMNRYYHSYREIFTDILLEGMSDGSFRKNINPGNVASIIIGALDGILFQWVLDKQNVDFAESLGSFKAIILKGIANG